VGEHANAYDCVKTCCGLINPTPLMAVLSTHAGLWVGGRVDVIECYLFEDEMDPWRAGLLFLSRGLIIP